MCVPAVDAHIGLPFLGPSSMSAAATRRAVDVLRREVRVAALTGGAEGMNDIEVVSLEVGALDIPPFAGRRMLDYDPKEYTKSWTPSEKLAYGPAWELTLEGSSRKCQYKAQKVERFVGDLVQIVSYGQVCSVSFCGLQIHFGSIFGWLRGGRYAVGSGGNVVVLSILAAVYLADISFLPLPSAVVVSSIVSHLPGAVLDIIINIPYYLLSIHKALTRNRESASISSSATALEPPPAPVPTPAPVPASRPLPSRPLPTRPLPTPPEAPATATMTVTKETVQVDSAPSSEHEHEASENGSEADVESNDSAGVGESWVSLQPNSTMASSETITA